jgi:hypothetical protein
VHKEQPALSSLECLSSLDFPVALKERKKNYI